MAPSAHQQSYNPPLSLLPPRSPGSLNVSSFFSLHSTTRVLALGVVGVSNPHPKLFIYIYSNSQHLLFLLVPDCQTLFYKTFLIAVWLCVSLSRLKQKNTWIWWDVILSSMIGLLPNKVLNINIKTKTVVLQWVIREGCWGLKGFLWLWTKIICYHFLVLKERK